eukprot:scaffold165050_cov55-Prasinocladus_malaysianus.AAC.1
MKRNRSDSNISCHGQEHNRSSTTVLPRRHGSDEAEGPPVVCLACEAVMASSIFGSILERVRYG